jgi:elongation factor 1-beta
MCVLNAGSGVPIKMAQVYVTLKIMPESPDVDLEILTDKASKLVKEFQGQIVSSSQNPIAFGLKAIELRFIMEEAKGSTEPLEIQISELAGVSSVDVIDVRRAIG